MEFRSILIGNTRTKLFSIATLLVLLIVRGPAFNTQGIPREVSGIAYASSGYACYDKPCSEERKEYVERWERRACAYSRSLDGFLRRKARGEQTRAQILARLNRCLARNPRRPGRCAFHTRRLRTIDRTLRDIQRRIDRLVARLQSSCNASLPQGGAGNPPTCEEREAMQYCPITDEEQAQRSMAQRCADLRAEKAQHALCGNCVNPNNLIAAASYSEELWIVASARPTCASIPTFTPVSTPAPEVTATPLPTMAIDVTVTPRGLIKELHDV